MSDEEYEIVRTMLSYFWGTSEDIEQWSGFENAKDEIKLRDPEILKAFKKFKKAKIKMSKVVRY